MISLEGEGKERKRLQSKSVREEYRLVKCDYWLHFNACEGCVNDWGLVFYHLRKRTDVVLPGVILFLKRCAGYCLCCHRSRQVPSRQVGKLCGDRKSVVS
jgi:hypothetical protein